MGDSCSAPPVNQTDPPRICRPACTASSTCFTATRELGGSPNCAPDGFCWAYCARTGAIGACTAAATCSTSGAPDGFCIRN